LLKDTVGNLRRLLEDVFDVVEENLFPRSLMGATIQDGGTRERRVGHIPLHHPKEKEKKRKRKSI